MVSDIDAAKAELVAAKIKANGGETLAVAGDLLKDASIKELAKKAAEFGSGKIHIIVNKAGFTWDAVIHKARSPFQVCLKSPEDIQPDQPADD